MKIKAHLVFVIFTMFITFGTVTVCADNSINVYVNYNDNSITVSGEVDVNLSGHYVTVQIFNPGKGIGDIFTDGALNWSAQGNVDDSGLYSFKTDINAVESEDYMYTAIVGITGCTKTLKKQFPIYSQSYIKALLVSIRKAADINAAFDMYDIMDKNKELFDFTNSTTYSEFSALPDSSKETVCLGMFKQEIDSVDGVKTAFDKSFRLFKMRNINDWKLYEKEIFLVCNDIAASVANKFNKYKETEKRQIVEELMENFYAYPNELLTAFTDLIIKREFNPEIIILWTEMQTALQEYNDALNINFSDYKSLANKSAVMSAMLGVTYESSEQIVKKFNDEVKKQKVLEAESFSPGDGSSGSSAGGGSSAGRGISVDSSMATSGGAQSTKGFTDLSNYQWAVESINVLRAKGVILGYDDGTYRPGNNVTRAEFVKMLVLAMNYGVGNVNCNFKDVFADDWFYEFLCTATQNNLIFGDGNGNFNPYDLITREDIAVVINRCASSKLIEKDTIEFADIADCAPYAIEAVRKLAGLGIANGDGNNSFNPKKFATRAEVAVLLVNTINIII